MSARARAAKLADTEPITAAGLRAIQEKYEADQLSAEQSRRRRNARVQEAVEQGWTHAQIAEATGLSRGRIGQMK